MGELMTIPVHRFSLPERVILHFVKVGMALCLTMSVLVFTTQTQATSLIRDSEMETLLRDYADPIFRAAGLKASKINIHLMRDPSINAFLTDDQNLFIHVGVLMNAVGPDELAIGERMW